MSNEYIIRELIDMVVLDRQLEDELKSMTLSKVQKDKIRHTRKVLDDARVRFLELLNEGK